jgi:hypothetical protein
MNEYLVPSKDYWTVETVIRPSTFYTIERLQSETRLSPVAIISRALGIVSITNVLVIPNIQLKINFQDGGQQSVQPLEPLPPLAEVVNLSVNVSNSGAQTLQEASQCGYRYGDTVDHGVRLYDVHRLAGEAGGTMVCSANGDDWYEVLIAE